MYNVTSRGGEKMSEFIKTLIKRMSIFENCRDDGINVIQECVKLINLTESNIKQCKRGLELISTHSTLNDKNKRELLDLYCEIIPCDNCKIKEKTGYIGFNCHICDEHIDDAVSLILENKE